MNKDDVKTLLDQNVDQIVPQLADKTLAELNKLRTNEVDGKTRSTLIEAIDRAIGDRQVKDAEAGKSPPAKNEDELQDQVAGDAHRVGQADSDQALIAGAAARDNAGDGAAGAGDNVLQGAGESLAGADQQDAAVGERPTTDATALGAGAGDGPASGGADNVLHDAGNGQPAGDQQTAAGIMAVPGDLTGYSHEQLQSFRTLQLERAGGDVNDPELARIDQALEDLAKRGKDALEIDGGSMKSRFVPTPATADAIKAGGLSLVLVEGDKPIQGLPPIQLDDNAFSASGDRHLLQRRVTVSRDVDRAHVSHAVLVDGSGETVGVCEIPHGLEVGGGREGEFPAGTLAF